MVLPLPHVVDVEVFARVRGERVVGGFLRGGRGDRLALGQAAAAAQRVEPRGAEFVVVEGVVQVAARGAQLRVREAVLAPGELEERREFRVAARRARDAEVYLVAVYGRLFREIRVNRAPPAANDGLFLAEGRDRGQQAEPLYLGNFVVVAQMSVVYLFAHHLVAAAEAVNCAAVRIEAADALREAAVD